MNLLKSNLFQKGIANLIFIMVLVIAATSFAANYPLEITQPQPNLDTKNRFYKAYPGLDYNVRLAVIGGAYPFTYSLITAPTGMTINSATGTIDWPNPTTTGSPFTINAQVKDQEGTTTTVTWTITVTTSGFIFVDGINGHTNSLCGGTGTGTISNPFLTLNDFFAGATCGKASNTNTDTTYQNYFVYFRKGSYAVNTLYCTNGLATDCRVKMTLNKPVVWLAYPGESPTIDNGTLYSLSWINASETNLYLDGFEFINIGNYGIQVGAETQGWYKVFRNLKMHDLTSPDTGNNNQSFIRFYSCGTDFVCNGFYTVIQDSVFYNLNHGAGIKIYTESKLLIEDNTFYNFSDTISGGGNIEGIAVKGGTTRVTIRHNVLHDIPQKAIGGNNHNSNNTEYLFNYIYNAATNAIDINEDNLSTIFYIYRNTFVGRVNIVYSTTGTGPFYFYNNIIVNNDAGFDGTSHIVCTSGCSNLSLIVPTNELVGTPTQNIIDAKGNLTAAYASNLGKLGYQINGQIPSPPTALTVK